MPIVIEKRYSPALCRSMPDALVVFGDNLEGRGKGGQAAIRDEPNAVGIPTKRSPSMSEDAFFSDNDEDMHLFRASAALPLSLLAAHLRAGGIIVLPEDGLGTGRAQLEQRSPRIWRVLQRAIKRLVSIGNTVEGNERNDR